MNNTTTDISTMNTTSLDLSNEEFKQLLDKSSELVLEQFNNMDTRKAYHYHSQKEVERWFDEELPQMGMDNFQLLEEVREKVLNTATFNMGPNMYAYVMAGGTQMSIIAEKLATTINQNVGKWHLAPAINEIEKRIIQWGGEMIGFSNNAGGVLVSGGSAANLAGLTVARNIFFQKNDIRNKGLFGQKPMIVYASKEVHGCVDKSVESLGIGSGQLRKITTNPDFTINLKALEAQIQEDITTGFQPFCIVGNAGTVNTGAIDDLEALAGIAKQYNLWFHVDGAYGALAASLDSISHKYKGIALADSVAIDFHKWLYQSFEAGCLMVKEWSMLKNAYFKKADYLDASLEQDNRLNFNEHYFQLSRNARALKIWMSMKSYGVNRIKEMIQKDIDLAEYLADEVEKSPDFQLKARSPLAIACFRYTGTLHNEADIRSVNRKLIHGLEKDGRVFITGTKLHDEFVLRACIINHRKQKQTMDYLLNVIREVAKDITP